MTEITLAELLEYSKNLKENELILDVRTPEEFASGHIRGAKNIPHTEVLGSLEELKSYDTIYIHCKRGGRAVTAADQLVAAGVTSLKVLSSGGMDDWLAFGYPVES
ncbi:MAG: rhodanese [Bdellovibrionaceae bacterium]|nr:rhodanese [Pseudobdellovibrionaceae bacterium]|tara:strand:+ start:7157 stop:7474 length:318 start_codon:yes stop_codon:yes gene_type:complete